MANAQDAALAAVAAVVAQSAFLATPDLSFHCAASRDVSLHLNSASAKLLRLLNCAVRAIDASGPAPDPNPDPDPDARDPAADSSDTLDAIESFSSVTVGAVDSALETCARCLESHSRVGPSPGKRRENPAQNTVAVDNAAPVVKSAVPVLRPQLSFADTVDNSASSIWKSKLSFKHNAKVPLDPSSSAHPYAFEIANIEYPAQVWEFRPEILYSSLDDTPFAFVDTVAEFDSMMELLNNVTEIALDLEHHDYRSFQGFTCLIQLSTRTHDFVIDALTLRAHLHRLNAVLSNPKVLKVLHGAESDVIWLQRDFACYIVGLFDTYHASKVLELEAHGLAFLLKNYCGVETNKKYQLADWRIRPIPKEMMKYARMDTHYLLYIYDRMRNDIVERDPDTKQPLRVVLERSETTSLRIYEKERFDSEFGHGANGWSATLHKSGSTLTPVQVHVLKALHAWRDDIARQEDESPRYVCPPHLLLQIAANCPKTGPSVLASCGMVVPNLVKVYCQEIARIVKDSEAAAVREFKAKDAEAADIIGKHQGNRAARDIPDDAAAVGAVHVRFEADSAPAAADGWFNGKTASSVIVTLKSPSDTSFGPFYRSSIANDPVFSALKEAEAIRASLFLVAPSFAPPTGKRDRTEAGRAPADDDGPAPKKIVLAPRAKVTANTVMTVKKGPTPSEPEPGTREEFRTASIPALNGPAFSYSDAADKLFDKQTERVDESKKPFDPYSVTNSVVDGKKSFGSKK
ncbi:exosome nuclease subunit [Entophlyctis luteolus]|nr:exosome nuclease subunit [Entophlyctis luteolus]